MKRGREVESEKVSEAKKKRSELKEFYDACLDGMLDRVRELCSNGVDVNFNFEERKYRTGLQGAAANGRVRIVKVLLQNGADVNAVNKDKLTPLHRAAEKGHVNVAKVLLQNGADVNAVDEEMTTALHHAAEYGWIRL